MPNYSTLQSSKFKTNRKFVIERLLNLKTALGSSIPQKTTDKNFILATWNIREFERASYGGRLEESYMYMAEIISHFDLVAIQEVREDLHALKKLKGILGPHWNYLVSDITEGRAGNGERMAYLYDSRKIKFCNVAGEVVLPPISKKVKKPGAKKATLEQTPIAQFSRTPYLVSFQSGWFKFYLCTVHILFGDTKDLSKRVEEIKNVAMFFKKRAIAENKYSNDPDLWDKQNFILLGDFNILDRTNETFKVLTVNTDFVIPDFILKTNLSGSNVSKDKFYDQIVYNANEAVCNAKHSAAGIFDYFEHIFKNDESDFKHYDADMKDAKALSASKNKTPDMRYYKAWRTYQMSDHLPMWVEFETDFSKTYLETKINNLL
ncbi:hypothetical protein BH10BAC2_BH10BAC2_40390 [soil metagenome]